MPAKLKVFFLALFWLAISALVILAFAGIITPHPIENQESKIELIQNVKGVVNKDYIATLRIEAVSKNLHASLSLDSSNRNAIINSLQLPGNLEDIYIDEDRGLAFLANSYSGLIILDVSDPENLRTVGSLHTPGKAWDIEVRDDILFLASTTGGLHLIDISSPENPSIISEFNIDGSPILGLVVTGQTVYAKTGKKGLLIVDITNINQPQLIKRLYSDKGVWGLIKKNNRLYISCGRSNLEVLEVSDPLNPQKIGELSVPGNGWDIAIRDNTLYLPTIKSGLLVVDVQQPEALKILHQFTDFAPCETIDLQHDRAYLSSRTGSLSILDISDPDNPKQIGTFNLPHRPRNILTRNQITFVAAGLNGLQLIDSNRLVSHDQIKNLKLPGNLINFVVEENLFYLASSNKVLYVCSVNSEGEPDEIISQLNTGYSLRAIIKHGNYLYLASPRVGMVIVDVSNPYSPVIAGLYDHALNITSLATSDNELFLTDRQKGLLALNIEVPDEPTLTWSLKLKNAKRLELADNLLYVATEADLKIFDYSLPLSESQIGALEFPWPLNTFAENKKIVVSGKRVYLAEGPAGLFSINVSKPSKPTIDEIISLGGDINTIATDHDTIYVMTRQGKLWLLHHNDDDIITSHAVIDSLGIGKAMAISTGKVFIANSIKDLTILPLPQQLELKQEKLDGRGNNSHRLTVKIPPQSKPGIYNINIFNDGKLTEFIGAVELQNTVH